MLRILPNYDLFSLSSEGEGIKILLALNVSSIKHEKVIQVLQRAVRVADDVCLAKSDLTSVCFCFRRFLNAHLFKLNME